jgi:hypothetical protein
MLDPIPESVLLGLHHDLYAVSGIDPLLDPTGGDFKEITQEHLKIMAHNVAILRGAFSSQVSAVSWGYHITKLRYEVSVTAGGTGYAEGDTLIYTYRDLPLFGRPEWVIWFLVESVSPGGGVLSLRALYINDVSYCIEVIDAEVEPKSTSGFGCRISISSKHSQYHTYGYGHVVGNVVRYDSLFDGFLQGIVTNMGYVRYIGSQEWVESQPADLGDRALDISGGMRGYYAYSVYPPRLPDPPRWYWEPLDGYVSVLSHGSLFYYSDAINTVFGVVKQGMVFYDGSRKRWDYVYSSPADDPAIPETIGTYILSVGPGKQYSYVPASAIVPLLFGVFNTKADLLAATGMTDADYAYVRVDADHSDACTRYDYTGGNWVYTLVISDTMVASSVDNDSGVSGTTVKDALNTLGSAVNAIKVVSKTADGLAPKLPDETTTTKYLRQDGTWVEPPDNSTTYSAGTGLSLSGTTFSLDMGASLTFTGTINVPTPALPT